MLEGGRGLVVVDDSLGALAEALHRLGAEVTQSTAVGESVEGWPDLRSERRAAAAGFDACAVKPVYSRDVAGLISHFLARERNGARTQ